MARGSGSGTIGGVLYGTGKHIMYSTVQELQFR